jgi:hypothetical protein
MPHRAVEAFIRRTNWCCEPKLLKPGWVSKDRTKDRSHGSPSRMTPKSQKRDLGHPVMVLGFMQVHVSRGSAMIDFRSKFDAQLWSPGRRP